MVLIARATDEEAVPEYRIAKVGTQPIFNRDVLYSSKKPIFIVEGAIDALSITTAGYEAVALGSTSGVNKFLDAVRERKPTQPLIIAVPPYIEHHYRNFHSSGGNCMAELFFWFGRNCYK